MTKFDAFTLKHNGTALQILSDCFVCQGFKPDGSKTKVLLKKFRALWDTGAMMTVISPKVVSELGLKPFRKGKMVHADGDAVVDMYLINIRLPNAVGFAMLPVMCSKLGDTDVLIGMDVISQGDFSITNAGGKTIFSFRNPSIREIDFVAEYNDLRKPVAERQFKPDGFAGVSLNGDCPCGSGKKYKRCHGLK